MFDPFTSTFTETGATVGQPFTASLATEAYDLNGGALTFSKVSGPAWLTVNSDGTVSGTPLPSDIGVNNFVVGVSDSGNLAGTATMLINVTPSAAIVASISLANTNLLINWTGGTAPYQVQVLSDLSLTNWENLGSPISSNSVLIPPTQSTSFYRILGQ